MEMTELEKVINGLCDSIGIIHGYVPKRYWGYGEQACRDAIAMLKEKESQKFFVDESGKITPLPVVVRCKDCIYRGNSEKCVLSAISEEKDFPLFMLDNRGEWFCADGVAKDKNVLNK